MGINAEYMGTQQCGASKQHISEMSVSRPLTIADVRFLTPPCSPGDQRKKTKSILSRALSPSPFSGSADNLLNQRGKDLRKRHRYLEKPNDSSDSKAKSSDRLSVTSILPFLDPAKKEWLLAAASNNHSSLCKQLLAFPGMLTICDPYTGYTALHWAAKHDNAAFLSLVHDMDSMAGNTLNVNVQSTGGYTPLHLAAINKSHGAFSVLMMDFKADRMIRDFSGKTPTSYLRSVITSNVELRKKS